jgi:hypothetical protein
MFEDMNDIEILTRMEKNYGPLSKKLKVFTTDAIDKLEGELLQLLHKYKTQMNVRQPIPRIRMWIQDNTVNFLFFDKATGKRVILGEWLENKNGYYEH